jgi:cytochrome b561
MSDTSRPSRYTRTAISLHWIIALIILAGFSLGLYMHDLPLSPQKLKYYSWHKWIGITIFLLAVLRVAWRLAHPAPALPATMSLWQRKAAVVSHGLLYVLILVIPITGWLYSSASGVKVVYLGLVPLPDLVSANKPLAAALKLVHKTLNFTLAAIVVMHAAAALKHHLIDRDDVLVRMLPFVKSRSR